MVLGLPVELRRGRGGKCAVYCFMKVDWDKKDTKGLNEV